MGNIGNLENFHLGMGLVVKPGEVIPAKNVAFEGYSPGLGQTNSTTPVILIIAIVLILLFFLK